MTEWVIERGIRIPPVDHTSFPNAKLKQALQDMQVGDCLFTTKIDRLRLNNAYMKIDHKFVSRAMDGGIRLWRVA